MAEVRAGGFAEAGKVRSRFRTCLALDYHAHLINRCDDVPGLVDQESRKEKMIKFFRSIRLGLLREGRLGKYLAYAIGEIALVVIGILIALQINNWNEARKSTQQETLYLKRLLSESRVNLITFKKSISDLERGIESIKNLSDALNRPDTADSALITAANDYFGHGSIYPIFTSSTSTFDDLSSTGNLKDISNSELRDQLVKHYALHDQAAERIRIGNEWALPIDAPFTYQNSIMRLEPVSKFLFHDQSSVELANHLREKKTEYVNNAAVHFWINQDAISQLHALIDDTSRMISSMETELH